MCTKLPAHFLMPTIQLPNAFTAPRKNGTGSSHPRFHCRKALNRINTLYMLFNEGKHSVPNDKLIRDDLCEVALRLCYLLLQNQITCKYWRNWYLFMVTNCWGKIKRTIVKPTEKLPQPVTGVIAAPP